MKAMIDAGVDGMFTNFLDKLIALLGKDKAHGKPGAKDAAEQHDRCVR